MVDVSAQPPAYTDSTPRSGVVTRELVVFIHIPKTAGTTVSDVLRTNEPGTSIRVANVFKGGGGVVTNPPWERMLSRLEEEDRAHFATGHVPFGIRDYLPSTWTTHFVTFLREPVDRAVSHYYQQLAMLRNPKRERVARTDTDDAPSIAENEDAPRVTPDTPLDEAFFDVRYVPDNLQTRMLCGSPVPFGEVTPTMLEQAKENLRSAFTVFGLAERFDESLVLLKNRLGYRDILYKDMRRFNPERARGHDMPPQLAEVARRANHLDIELYAFACELFDALPDHADPDFQIEVTALRRARIGEEAARPIPAWFNGDDAAWQLVVDGRIALLERERDLSGARQELTTRVSDGDALRAKLSAQLESVRAGAQRLQDQVASLQSEVIPGGGSHGPLRESGLPRVKGKRRAEGGKPRLKKRRRGLDGQTETETETSSIHHEGLGQT